MRKIILTIILVNIFFTPGISKEYEILPSSLLLVEDQINTNLLEKEDGTWTMLIPDNQEEDLVLFPKTVTIKNVETLRNYEIVYNQGLAIYFENDTQKNDAIITYTIKPQNKTNYYFYYTITMFVIIIVLLYYIQKTRKEQKQKILKTLSDNEKKIVKALQENENKLSQKRIQKITKIPKSTLSRTIDKLEKKEIITKIEKGLTNKIKLKKTLSK